MLQIVYKLVLHNNTFNFSTKRSKIKSFKKSIYKYHFKNSSNFKKGYKMAKFIDINGDEIIDKNGEKKIYI